YLLDISLSPTPTQRYLRAGFCVGAALLFKPPFFPAVVVVGLGTLAVALLRDACFDNVREPASLMRRAGVFFLPAIAIPLPHYLIAWRQIWTYFIQNSFGEYGKFWGEHQLSVKK